MKKKLALASLLFCLLVTLAYAATLQIATGTIVTTVAGIKSFTNPVKHLLVINNRNGSAVPLYIKLNDTGPTSATLEVSTTVYDFVLDQNEDLVLTEEFLRKFPVSGVGLYTATTPVVRVVGY